ncbi:serine/threonine-protein kinase WNK4 isoform X3 [Paralichthys olivaceus]|uniref:serine/threonine-protein kinase WNK4 isoform X3 n=1 Tax=Paralichthys olivaceus TaxID=8255 RepID=UPI0037521BFF
MCDTPPPLCLHEASPQDGEHQVVHHSHRDLTTAAANQDGAGESCGSIPALVVTQADECPAPGAVVGPPLSPAPSEPQRAARPAHQVAPENLFTDLCSSSDGGDMTCCDLLSLRSDSVSLGSETSVSRRSEDDDTRSVTASSVTSLFHRVQLDPLEKAWLRSSALGNMAAQRQLLAQEPGLVVKKTALHWAAKQGRQEVVDMMLRSGADVNVRSHVSVSVTDQSFTVLTLCPSLSSPSVPLSLTVLTLCPSVPHCPHPLSLCPSLSSPSVPHCPHPLSLTVLTLCPSVPHCPHPLSLTVLTLCPSVPHCPHPLSLTVLTLCPSLSSPSDPLSLTVLTLCPSDSHCPHPLSLTVLSLCPSLSSLSSPSDPHCPHPLSLCPSDSHCPHPLSLCPSLSSPSVPHCPHPLSLTVLTVLTL